MIFLLVFLLIIGTLSENVVNAQPQPQPGCDIGPNALTDARGYDIPQTCIPFEDGNGSIERCFYTFVPPCATTDDDIDGDASSTTRVLLPLVMDIHGRGSCPLYSSGYTGWFEKAIEECFVVVWPMGVTDSDVSDNSCFAVPGGALTINDDGRTRTPPCCCTKGANAFLAEPTDPDFLRAVIETVVNSFKSNSNSILVDTTRIYMAGHSNGCISSLSMAALHSDIVAAVCCHSGTLITPFPSEQSTTEPVPTWLVHGRLDAVIPYDGFDFFGNIGLWSVGEVVDYIAYSNGCDEEITQMNIVDESSGETATIHKRSTNCTNNATVELLELPMAGHIPYVAYDFGETMIDTTAMAWEFCSSHSKVNIPLLFAGDGTMSPSTTSPTPDTTSYLSYMELTTNAKEKDDSSSSSYSFSAPLIIILLQLLVWSS